MLEWACFLDVLASIDGHVAGHLVGRDAGSKEHGSHG